MLTFSIDCRDCIDCHTVYRISHIVLLVALVVVALTAVTAWWQRRNNSSVKFWQWQTTDIDSDSRLILTVPGTDGGGTLDRASACPATHIHSYAKTFPKFLAIYNHLSHFHICNISTSPHLLVIAIIFM